MNDLLRHLLATDPVSPYTHTFKAGEPVPTSDVNGGFLVPARHAKAIRRLLRRADCGYRRPRRGATGGKRWRG